jgi:argininosuccinate lyase
MSKGRFAERLDPGALRFSSSLPVDARLYREDIEGSLAHVRMLARRRIVPAAAARKIERGLLSILQEIETGVWDPARIRGGRWAGEDIHMAIEARLRTKIGEAADMLHTARSRNDQVALDERLFIADTIHDLDELLADLQRALVRTARAHRDVLMPGYTHLQRGQPILLPHHLLAYVGMLHRDRGRLSDCWLRSAVSPLGAAAMGGTPHPVDRAGVAKHLGLPSIVDNSIDAVSDRDALIEFVAACATIMMHLSRFAEELVLWSSREWRFVTIGEAFTTGSSIMPQKRNPDIAELIRGKTGRVYGDLVALLTVMKGLPLAYNRDMQEDKEPLFDAADTVAACVKMMAAMTATLRFDAKFFFREEDDGMYATELADHCVRKGLPFRQAHVIVGDLVRVASERGVRLRDLPRSEYTRRSPVFRGDFSAAFDPRKSVERKRSSGSTSPREVDRQLTHWTRILGRR